MSRISRGRFAGMALADLGSQVPVHRVLNEPCYITWKCWQSTTTNPFRPPCSRARISSASPIFLAPLAVDRDPGWQALARLLHRCRQVLMADMTDSVLKANMSATLNMNGAPQHHQQRQCPDPPYQDRAPTGLLPSMIRRVNWACGRLRSRSGIDRSKPSRLFPFPALAHG